MKRTLEFFYSRRPLEVIRAFRLPWRSIYIPLAKIPNFITADATAAASIGSGHLPGGGFLCSAAVGTHHRNT